LLSHIYGQDAISDIPEKPFKHRENEDDNCYYDSVHRPFVVAAKLVHPAIVPNTHDFSIKVAMVKALSDKSSCHLSSLHCMMDALTSQTVYINQTLKTYKFAAQSL